MSLDVYLTGRKKIECDCGRVHFVESEEVYCANITHNLAKMANAVGIYNELWRPHENGIDVSNQLIKPLSDGLKILKSSPRKLKKFNPSNGWGDRKTLIQFVEKYLAACIENPDASVRVSG